MISSLLERSSKRVVIDRIVKDDNSDIVLVNQKEEVLEEVRNHFKKQFCKRNTRASDMPSRWKEVYNPLEKVNSRIYDSLGNKISEEEWLKALKETKSKSAPGPSGISYPLIKKAGSIAQKVFIYLADLCIKEGEIPNKWKLSQLYPIPKGED